MYAVVVARRIRASPTEQILRRLRRLIGGLAAMPKGSTRTGGVTVEPYLCPRCVATYAAQARVEQPAEWR